MFFAALAALISAVLNLGFAGAEMSGYAYTALDPVQASIVVGQTFYGNVFLVRAVLLIGLCLLCIGKGAHLAKAMAAGLALALLGLTSHAAAAGSVAYEYARAANDAMHLLTAGFWVGGLVVLLPQAFAQSFDLDRVVALLRLFSRWATISVALLILSGTLNGIAILSVQGMAWSATYVTLLAIKVTLGAVMVALALTNRFGVLPALQLGEKEAAETIPLTVGAELLCALVILAIVGFLGLSAPMAM